jgi:hypothetical protein
VVLLGLDMSQPDIAGDSEASLHPSASAEKRGKLFGGNLTDEVIASSRTVLQRGRGGLIIGTQQYFTPEPVARFIASVLNASTAVLDPTAGDGSLLVGFGEKARFGIEIDGDQINAADAAGRPFRGAHADLQRLYPLLRRLGAAWPQVVCNPPFGLKWEIAGVGSGSSTALGFKMARGLLRIDGTGCIIAGRERFRDEVLSDEDARKRFFAIVEVEKLFPGVDLPCVVGFWREEERPEWTERTEAFTVTVKDWHALDPALADAIGKAKYEMFGCSRWSIPAPAPDLYEKFDVAQGEYARRSGKRHAAQKHTIELRDGRLSVKPTPFVALTLAQRKDGATHKWLQSFDRQTPVYFALQSREWRRILTVADEAGLTIDPKAVAAVETAIADAEKLAVPLYQVNTTQRLGFLTDVDLIRCTLSDDARGFVAGEEYPISCSTQVLASKARREKQTVEGPIVVDVVVERKAMQITIAKQEFSEAKEDLEYLLAHFDVPNPGELATRFPAEVAKWEQILRDLEKEIQEREPGFRFRAFQLRDLARLLCKGGGILAHEQGLGKTLQQGAFVRALERAGKLPDGCALFIMPQDLAQQATAEMRRFFGREMLFMSHLGSDLAHPRKRKPNEVSALELRERVRARRADLAGQWRGVHLAPRAPVWAATWFEALATTGRIEERLPTEKVKDVEEIVQKAEPEHWGCDQDGQTRLLPATEEIRAKRPVYSNELCPRCGMDRDGGWDGTVCQAQLADAKGHRKTCGYVHRRLFRKPAYRVLGKLFDVVLCDEGTKIKGDDSYTSKAVRAIRARYRLLATGTPLKNFVVDLYWLLWWALGDSSARFPYAYVGGKERFTNDFAVLETRLDEHKRKAGPAKMLPEVSNLLRLWKMLCSSVVRRRMDEVGAVVGLDGAWTCPDCKLVQHASVDGPDGWTKPAYLECLHCKSVWDSIVPITFVPIETPWGHAQRRFYADWLDSDNFASHFLSKHPDSPLAAHPAVVKILAPCLGQLAKLDYATTDPPADPDDDFKTPELSSWTPGRLKILQLAAKHARAGERVLIGSCLVAPGPWIADELSKRGLRAVHICEQSADGKLATKAPAKRSQAVADFRGGKADVLCVGVNAMCLGHNLDCASVVIVDGLPWDYATWDQFIKRARRLTSRKPVIVYVIMPSDSLATRKWVGLNFKTDASDLALDGKLSARAEEKIDRAKILRELQERGVHFDGTEIPEAEVQRLWAVWDESDPLEPPPAPEPKTAGPRKQMAFDFLAAA